MQLFPVIVLAAAVSTAVLAQSGTDHAAHHPEGASAPADTSKPAVPAAAKPAAAAPAQMDTQMKAMREMRDKMMAAKTPEERQALMGEHMKAMQGGMAMMGRMKGPDGQRAGMAMDHDMMAKRMEMMETMMQMMMDREAARAAAAK